MIVPSTFFVILGAVCLILAAITYRSRPDISQNNLLMAIVLILIGIYEKLP